MSKEDQTEEMAITIYKNTDVSLECANIIAGVLIRKGYRRKSENAIELPCKIGDTVYIIDEAEDECGEDYVLAVKVLQFFINEHGIAIDLALPLGMRLNTWMVVGENVFLTEEEAEKVLAERSRQ
jgi:hypothetical protein